MSAPIVRWRTSWSLPAWALVAALSLCGCGAPVEDAASDEASPAGPSSVEYDKWQTTRPGEQLAYNRRANLIQRGHTVYNKYCVGCHGVNGDGNGPAAKRLITKPRDFTSGIYKFRSTDSGSLPLDTDLYRTITRGLAQVSMPDFPLMPERDKIAVIEYIKSFYPAWDEEKEDRVIVPVPPAPSDLDSEERILRGRVTYLDMQCWSCHGIDGQGELATQTEYLDAWDNPQRAFNFTRGSLKSGNDPEDIYRTFHTGLRSVMPAFGDDTLALVTRKAFETPDGFPEQVDVAELRGVLDQFPATPSEVFSEMSKAERLELAERNSWDLVAYIRSLRTQETTAPAVLGFEE